MEFDANEGAKDLLLVVLLRILTRVAASGGEEVAMKIAADMHAVAQTFELPNLDAGQMRAVRHAFDAKMALLEQGLLNAARRAPRQCDKESD